MVSVNSTCASLSPSFGFFRECAINSQCPLHPEHISFLFDCVVKKLTVNLCLQWTELKDTQEAMEECFWVCLGGHLWKSSDLEIFGNVMKYLVKNGWSLEGTRSHHVPRQHVARAISCLTPMYRFLFLVCHGVTVLSCHDRLLWNCKPKQALLPWAVWAGQLLHRDL